MKLNFLLLIAFTLLFREGSTCAPEPAAETTGAPTDGTASTDSETTAATDTTSAAETTEGPANPLTDCLGDGVTCKEFKDGTGVRAETGDELECDFDGAPGCDCWSNKKPDDDQNEWLDCSGEVDSDAVQACFKTTDVPSGNFIATYVTTKQESGAQAIFFSCTIGCAMGGSVTVKQWTLNADLKACIQSRLDALASPICQEFETDGAQTITFPSGSKMENFDVQFTASDFIGNEGGLAIIDDIRVELLPCEDETTTAAPGASTTTTAGGEETTPSERFNACEFSCGIDAEQPCEDVFDFDNQEGDSQWQLYMESIGNFDSGTPLPEEGKFYGCIVAPGEFCSMITQEPIQLAGKQFRVKHYDATENLILKFCIIDELGGDEGNCGVETDFEYSEDDNNWNTLFTDFDSEDIKNSERFHIICDNREGANYGTCGFSDMTAVDDGAPQEKTGPLECTDNAPSRA